MSKREFIRNTQRAAQNISEDLGKGTFYDNIPALLAMWLHKGTVAGTSAFNCQTKATQGPI